jgi:DNA-binding PadR family transcriptional regulator
MLVRVIELAILGLLREQELHGYELKKRISEVAGPRTVSFGSLYPALARLEASGAVKAVEAATRPRPVPLTGSLSGEASVFRSLRRSPERPTRGKKSYGITERGERLLEELLEDPTSDDKAFRAKVAFCRYLPPTRRVELFQRRRAHLVEQLRTAGATRRRGGGERFDAYLRSLREHDHDSVEREIAWLDRLIAAEQDGTAGAAAADPTTGS